MYNNAKTNELMDSCIELAEKGESIYTKEQEEEIRLIFHQSIRKGINFTRIYEKELSIKYPLPKGEGLFASYTRLREIFQQEVYRYKKETSIDKENMWNLLYERYNELFFNETDKHDVVGQKKVLDSMLRLLSAAAQEKALDQAKEDDKNITYVLDFNI